MPQRSQNKTKRSVQEMANDILKRIEDRDAIVR